MLIFPRMTVAKLAGLIQYNEPGKTKESQPCEKIGLANCQP